jgi:hypothetical protein
MKKREHERRKISENRENPGLRFFAIFAYFASLVFFLPASGLAIRIEFETFRNGELSFVI